MKSQKSSASCAVLVGVDPAHARRRALVDVAEQARAGPTWPARLKTPLLQVRTGKTRSSRSTVSRIAQACAYGPEVAGALALGAAHDLHPRELLAHRHGEERVGLVVAVLDVEPRVELLDPGVLQLQGLDLGGDHGPLDATPPW